MRITKYVFVMIFVLALCFIPTRSVNAGLSVFNNNLMTDASSFETLIYFFDLRDRESFIQLTYTERVDQGISAKSSRCRPRPKMKAQPR